MLDLSLRSHWRTEYHLHPIGNHCTKNEHHQSNNEGGVSVTYKCQTDGRTDDERARF